MEAATATAQPRNLSDLLRSSITVVWLVLIVATLTSWWLGTDHGFSNEDLAIALVATTIVLTLVSQWFYRWSVRRAWRNGKIEEQLLHIFLQRIRQ